MATTKECGLCKAKFGIFKWKHLCESCGHHFCSECIAKLDEYEWTHINNPNKKYPNGALCDKCWAENINEFDAKYRNAVHAYKKIVKIYPSTYKGNINLDRNVPITEIESDYHKARTDADKQLMVDAILLEYDIVVDVTHEKETRRRSGNYRYSVWKAVGKAGKQAKY